MLAMPDVSLVVVETMAHELARLAVEDCLKVAEFGDVFVYSDDLEKLKVPGARNQVVENWPTKIGCGRFSTFEIAKPVHTSHILFLEWDAGIVDQTRWRSDFLEFDYIGAPWWYTDGRNVGNGGFSLRSKRLVDFLSANRDGFPAVTDDSLCRHYRHALEEAGGFRWAPDDVARDFAFECLPPTGMNFGFHAMRNWPHVFDRDKLIERARIGSRSDYIRGPSHLGQLLNAAPWLRQEIA